MNHLPANPPRRHLPGTAASASLLLLLAALAAATALVTAVRADQTGPPAQPPAAVDAEPPTTADPATADAPADPVEHLQELRQEFNETRQAIHAGTVDDPAAYLHTVIDRLLALIEPVDPATDPPLPWRSYGSWTSLCDETVRLLRRHDDRSPEEWRQFHQHITGLLDRQTDTRPATDPASGNHAVLSRRLLVMLLHLLPADYAAQQLDKTHRQLVERGDPTKLGAWLRDLHTLAPPVILGDAVAPAVHPALQRGAERMIFDLMRDDRIDYPTRRTVLRSLAGKRYSSGQSPEAARLVDHWLRTHPDETSDDINLAWLRFNIALFGEGDRETAWRQLIRLQRLAGDADEGSRAATITGHASHHYYNLLPFSQLEYERIITLENNRYLDQRRAATSNHASAHP